MVRVGWGDGLVESICQFPWYKYSHRGWCQLPRWHHWTWSLEVCMVAHCYKASLPYRGDVAVVQPLNHIWLFAILWTAAHLASQSLTISQSSPKFTESVMPSREGGMVRHCSEVTQANIVKRIKGYWVPVNNPPTHPQDGNNMKTKWSSLVPTLHKTAKIRARKFNCFQEMRTLKSQMAEFKCQ